MFTYVIAIFIAIAALARRVLRYMYRFSSFTEDEKKEIQKTLDVSEDNAVRLSSHLPMLSYLLVALFFYCYLFLPLPLVVIHKYKEPYQLLVKLLFLGILVFGIFCRRDKTKILFYLVCWIIPPFVVFFLNSTSNRCYYFANFCRRDYNIYQETLKHPERFSNIEHGYRLPGIDGPESYSGDGLSQYVVSFVAIGYILVFPFIYMLASFIVKNLWPIEDES